MLIRSRAPLTMLAVACVLGQTSCAAPPATATPETVTATLQATTAPPSPTPIIQADVMLTSRADSLATLHAQETVYALTPTVTPHPPQTYAPPTPTPVFGSGAVGDDFLFGNQPPGCVLPCWQGLAVGESDDADVQQALETAFGFDGNYDFFKHHWQSDIPGLLLTGYRWDFASVSPEGLSPDRFTVSVWIREDTRLLEAIQFEAFSPRFSRFTSPQLVLRELGVPSEMWAQVQGSEDAHQGMGSITIIYGEGTVFDYPAIPVSIDRQQDGSGIAELCLGPQFNTTYYLAEISLTRPVPSELDALSPIQKELFGNVITMSYSPFVPFEEAFGLSLEEITSLAQQQQNPCVYTNVP